MSVKSVEFCIYPVLAPDKYEIARWVRLTDYEQLRAALQGIVDLGKKESAHMRLESTAQSLYDIAEAVLAAIK